MDSSNPSKPLIDAAAAFLRDVLDTRHVPAPRSRHTLGGDMHKRRSFAEAIVEDGHATFYRGRPTPNVYARRAIEAERAAFEHTLAQISEQLEIYLEILVLMKRTSHLPGAMLECVSLLEIFGREHRPSIPYFSRLSLDESGRLRDTTAMADDQVASFPVSVGGLARALSSRVEDAVSRWLESCEHALNAVLDDELPDGEELEFSTPDKMRTLALRTSLARVLSRHIAMHERFKSSPSKPMQLTAQPPLVTPKTLGALLTNQLDAEAHERLRQRRDDELGKLRLLRRVCAPPNAEDDVIAVVQHRVQLGRALRTPPRALARNPDFDETSWRLGELTHVVRSASSSAVLVGVHLDAWRTAVGELQLARLVAAIDAAAASLEAAKLPESGFVPTLHMIDVPTPPWTDSTDARAAVESTHSTAVMGADHTADAAALLPLAIERSLRLISLVWELLGRAETAFAFFAPGRVRLPLVIDVIGHELVVAGYAESILRSWVDAIHIGCTFRKSHRDLIAFRGGDLEDNIRTSARHLSGFSLEQLLRVFDETYSANYDKTRWKLIDATCVAMGRDAFHEYVGVTSIVVDACLDVAVPVLLDLRSEVGLRSTARPSALGDFLRQLKAVREWDPNDRHRPLVLEHSDVEASGKDAIKLLKEMSSRGSPLVRFGRLPRSDPSHGRRLVYRFDPYELQLALGADLDS